MASLQQMYREIEAQREILELVLRNQQALTIALIRIHGEELTTELRIMRVAIDKFLRENVTTTIEL